MLGIHICSAMAATFPPPPPLCFDRKRHMFYVSHFGIHGDRRWKVRRRCRPPPPHPFLPPSFPFYLLYLFPFEPCPLILAHMPTVHSAAHTYPSSDIHKNSTHVTHARRREKKKKSDVRICAQARPDKLVTYQHSTWAVIDHTKRNQTFTASYTSRKSLSGGVRTWYLHFVRSAWVA